MSKKKLTESIKKLEKLVRPDVPSSSTGKNIKTLLDELHRIAPDIPSSALRKMTK